MAELESGYTATEKRIVKDIATALLAVSSVDHLAEMLNNLVGIEAEPNLTDNEVAAGELLFDELATRSPESREWAVGSVAYDPNKPISATNFDADALDSLVEELTVLRARLNKKQVGMRRDGMDGTDVYVIYKDGIDIVEAVQFHLSNILIISEHETHATVTIDTTDNDDIPGILMSRYPGTEWAERG